MPRPRKHGEATVVMSLRLPERYAEAIRQAAGRRKTETTPAELVMRLVELAGWIEPPPAREGAPTR